MSFETITDSLRNECHVVKFGNAIKKHWYIETSNESPEFERFYEINPNMPYPYINNNNYNNNYNYSLAC